MSAISNMQQTASGVARPLRLSNTVFKPGLKQNIVCEIYVLQACLGLHDVKKKLKISLLQAMEAHRVARG
jgi:hypothetical protein